jgi:hypothetical protein
MDHEFLNVDALAEKLRVSKSMEGGRWLENKLSRGAGYR